MSLRRILIIASTFLIIVESIFAWPFLSKVFGYAVSLSLEWWLLIIGVIGLQLLGHYFRTKRTKLVIDQVKKGSTSEQFDALAVGYLFNMLLPFRIGEVIRALLIANHLRISFLYTFTAVVLERAIDLLMVGVLAVGLALLVSGQAALAIGLAAVGAIGLSVVFLAGIVLLTREDKRLLNFIWRITGLFNQTLSNKLRFKVWTLIYGLQQFFNKPGNLRRYMLMAGASWVFYLASTTLIAVQLLNVSGVKTFVAAAAPYIAAGAPTTVIRAILPDVSVGNLLSQDWAYIYVLFVVITLPMAVIGFVYLFVLRDKIAKRGKASSTEVFVNKLRRDADISQEFPVFLEHYFSGNKLARILHKLETTGQLQLVKFFVGGSDAITVLVLKDETLFVKKIIPLEYESRLKSQYNWLVKHKKMKFNVEVLGEQKTDEFYAIDLAYDPENVELFEFIHHNSLAASKKVIESSWKAIYKEIHAKAAKLQSYPKKRDAYIKKHIIGCVDIAAEAHEGVRKVLKQERVTINGVEYDNLNEILEKIKNNKQAWEDLATYRQSHEVHGDPAVNNILVSATTGQPLIIDPAPDGNIIEGAVLDMCKLMQSLYCGYEFSFRDDDPVPLKEDGSINYRDLKSEKYMRLTRFLRKELAPKYLSEAEQRALIFHAGAMHFRRMKHHVKYNYSNTLKFYAVGVKSLNEFLAQYETEK